MLRILLIAGFCLLLKQVEAFTCCMGFDSCSQTCETSNRCTKISRPGKQVAMGCDGYMGMPELCKNTGCRSGKVGEMCCCYGNKCNGGDNQYGSLLINGGDLQYGSVLMTLIMAVLIRFI